MADAWALIHGDAGRSGDGGRAGEEDGRRAGERHGRDGAGEDSVRGEAASGDSRDAGGGGRRGRIAGDGERPARKRGKAGHDRPVVMFLRANPQVLVLLVICVVLGLGTFLAVVFGLLTAGSGHLTGEPSGAVLGAHATSAVQAIRL
jgi:hypothetical protein